MNLTSSKSINIKIMSLTAFKELTKEFRAEIIIITSENIKR